MGFEDEWEEDEPGLNNADTGNNDAFDDYSDIQDPAARAAIDKWQNMGEGEEMIGGGRKFKEGVRPRSGDKKAHLDMQRRRDKKNRKRK